jgi:hypothetical protein
MPNSRTSRSKEMHKEMDATANCDISTRELPLKPDAIGQRIFGAGTWIHCRIYQPIKVTPSGFRLK